MAKLAVLYDGKCGLCRASVERLRRMDRGERVELVDLHTPGVEKRFPQVNIEQAMRSMQAVDTSEGVYGGVDAWARIGMELPGWNLAAWVLRVPGVHFVAGKFYAWVARNRYRWNQEACADGSCALHVEPAKGKGEAGTKEAGR